MAGITFSNAAGMWDGSNGGGRVLLYDAAGAPIFKTNLDTFTPTGSVGVPQMFQDGRELQIPRLQLDGSVQTNVPMLVFMDTIEGATINTDRWIVTSTVMSASQAVGTGTLYNSASSVAATVGYMLTSKTYMPVIPVGGYLRYRARTQHGAHFNNNVIEMGFADPSTATNAVLVNGAVWRKDGSGQYVPVLVFNSGTEILGTPISNATLTALVNPNGYFETEIHVYDDYADFWLKTSTGTTISYQRVDVTSTTGTFGSTHLRVCNRMYNSGVVATAVQCRFAQTVVDIIDRAGHFRPWGEQMTSLCLDGMTSPLSFLQSANWQNSLAATTRTLANTTAAEATLGGLLVANSVAGATTDYIMFAFQVPTPYTYMLRGISISTPLNGVVAVATTDTVFQYFFATNSTAVSLATASAMRRALPGFHRGAVGLAAGVPFSGTDIVASFANGIPIFPGRYLHIGCRAPVGTATATETFTWEVAIDGYYV